MSENGTIFTNNPLKPPERHGDLDNQGPGKKPGNDAAETAAETPCDAAKPGDNSPRDTKTTNGPECPQRKGLKKTRSLKLTQAPNDLALGEHPASDQLNAIRYAMLGSLAGSQAPGGPKPNGVSSLTTMKIGSNLSNDTSVSSADSYILNKASDPDSTRPYTSFNSHPSVTIQPISQPSTKEFDKYFRNFSMYNLRALTDDNEVWKHLVKRIEPFLDVYSILMLRQTCRTLYYYKYRLRSHGTLLFTGFAGFDSKWIFDTILPLIHHVLDLPENCRIKFDFTGCVLLRDIAVVYLLRSDMVSANLEMRQYARTVRELVFDYCHQLTDKGLEVMLATKLPNLTRLSVKCCRNENFTGHPFTRALTETNWPKFTRFRCQFSNFFLEPLHAVADFIYRNAMEGEHSTENANGTQLQRSMDSEFNLPALELSGETPKELEHTEFSIVGSWGSRKLLEKLGLGMFCTSLTHALKTNNVNMCSKLTKNIQTQLFGLSQQPNMKNNHLVQLIKNCGSELLVNVPITYRDRTHNNLGVWTLPILLVIHQQNMDMFELLIKRGARLSIWDSMKKSPLLVACELGLEHFVAKILKFNVPPTPYDVSANIPLTVAIKNSNVAMVKLFLENNFQLNYKCPSIKKYMSPLYFACVNFNPAIIRLLLEHGADPNWKYRHRSTPTLLGYQQDPKMLETFLDYGAGASSEKRWVLVQVLACALVKNDINSVDLLTLRYPDLVEREHEIWSKPLVAAAKLNRVEILRLLLSKNADVNTFDSYGTTALHAASEEANMESVRLLLEHAADPNLQDVFGRTPLHLAILENKPHVVTALLERDARLDLKEYAHGETALMTAIRTRNEAIATKILKTGRVDATLADYQGQNASDYLHFYKMAKLEPLLGTNCP